MKCSAIASVLAVVSYLGLGPADAGVFELRAQIQGGGAGGKGVSGAQMDNAFHAGAQGVTYGAAVGAEIMFIDGWIEHYQYLGSDGLIGTWTQFMAGLDLNVDIGEQKGDAGKEYSSMFAEIGVGLGFGVGTGQQVVLPLDNAQVSDKGFLVQGHLAVGYRLSRTLSVGVTVPVQGGYLFKSGPGLAANDEGTQYMSVHGAAMLNLRLDIPIK